MTIEATHETILDVSTGGQTHVTTPASIVEAQVKAYLNANTSYLVNLEAARRVAQGFTVPSVGDFDCDAVALSRITGAATLAGFAMASGSLAGDYLWHGGATPFQWILQDNTTVSLDAPTMFAVGQAAANWESDHIFAGRALKDLPELPLDYEADTHWP